MQNISDPMRYYYQQPGADEPLGISGQKTWSQAVTSDPRNHMYNLHQPAGTNRQMRIIPGKREWTQIVANPRRYNQQPGQADYQTGRGNQSKQHPMGLMDRQKWPSQQGGSRFNELGTGQHHISTLRQRARMHKPFHYGGQNRIGNNIQLMGSNPLPVSGTTCRRTAKSRGNPGSKKPSKVSMKNE